LGDEFEDLAICMDEVEVNSVVNRKKIMCKKIRSAGLVAMSLDLESFIDEVFSKVDEGDNIETAVKDYGDVVVNSKYVEEADLLLKEAEGNLEVMVKNLQSGRVKTRMSLDRVVLVCSIDNPDFELLCSIADNGMPVIKPDCLVPNNAKPKLRQLGIRVKGAINHLSNDLAEKKNAIILSKKAVEESKLVLHFGATHWTTKTGKSFGRMLLDLGNEESSPPLNSKDAKHLCKEFFGAISLPSLNDIILMILKMEDQFGNDVLILWKMDLRGAFTLLDVSALACKWFAAELTNDLILIYITGLFGWTGTPFAFNVLSRAILFEALKLSSGDLLIYVDDLIGCCRLCDLDQELLNVRYVVEGICGPGSIAEDKTEYGRSLESIGYFVDLDARAVGLSRNNFLRTVYGMFAVDLNVVTVREMQRLASWCSRYANVVTWLKPFSRELYRSIRGLVNQNMRLDLKGSKKKIQDIIELWIQQLILVKLDVKGWGRNFDTFKLLKSDVIMEFDAGLEGFGMGLYDINTNILMYGFQFYEVNLFNIINGSSIQNSSFQNSMEFIAVVLGLFWIISLDLPFRNLTVRGDSTVALYWSRKQVFRSRFCDKAVLVFSQLQHKYHFNIVSSVHIKGADNCLCDSWSRNKVVKDTLLPGRMSSVRCRNLNDKFLQLIQFVNPNNFYYSSIKDDLTVIDNII
jgi:hypothetical protein